MGKSEQLIKLINLQDFEALRKYLIHIKRDFNLRSNTGCILNILDYYIIYEISRTYYNDMFHKALKYAIDFSNKSFEWFVLPVSYYEMQNNLGFIKHNVLQISHKDILVLKKDSKVEHFLSTMKLYENDRSIILYQDALESFKEAFLLRKEASIVSSFNKIIKFYYSNKLFIQPFVHLMELLEDGNLMQPQEIKRIAKISKFDYDAEIYRLAFLHLNPHRIRLHSDIIDSLCYAMSINLKKELDGHCGVRFITSQAPFVSFFENSALGKPGSTIVRNIAMLAIEKYLLEGSGNNLKKAISETNLWLNMLNKIVDGCNYYKKENIKYRRIIRRDFRNKLNDKISKIQPGNQSDNVLPFLQDKELMSELLNDMEGTDFLKYFHEAFSEAEKIANAGELEVKKNQVRAAFDDILKYFRESIADRELMNHVNAIKRIVDKYKKNNIPVDINDIENHIETILDKNMSDDAADWDKHSESTIKEILINKRTNVQIKGTIRRYFKEAKDGNKLNFALRLKTISDDVKFNLMGD